MILDGFEGLEVYDESHRMEKPVHKKTKLPTEVTKETCEMTIVFNNYEHFIKVDEYLKGRSLVYISDWKYDDGFYVIRGKRVNQKPTTMEMTLTADYNGKEDVYRSSYSPVAFNYQVIAEEDFADWSLGVVSSSTSSTGKGRQYGEITYGTRGATSNANIVVTSSIRERPDKNDGQIYYNAAIPHYKMINDLNEYTSYEVRASFATPEASTYGASIMFKVQDWKTSEVPKTGFKIGVTPTAIQLIRLKGEGAGEVIIKSWTLADYGFDNRPTTGAGEVYADEWYDIAVRCYGPVMEIYYNGKYVDTFKFGWNTAGAVGWHMETVECWLSEFFVKRLPIPAYSMGVGAYNISEFVHTSSYTRDGWVQRVINPINPVKHYLKTYPKGLVRVWDMRDGDMRTPGRWLEVTDPSHEFLGDLFVENGIGGMWYTGGQLFYAYNEYLKDVVVGYDTSAWWSQGYSLRDLATQRGVLSPTAMAGSLFKQFGWKDGNWYLKPRDVWSQNRTVTDSGVGLFYDLPVMINPEIEARFFLQSWLPDPTYGSGSRILSWGATNVRSGINLCAPDGVLTAAIAESTSIENLTEGSILASNIVYDARFHHASNSRLLFLNGRLDNYEPLSHEHHMPYPEASTIVPMAESTSTIEPTLGGINKMLIRDGRAGQQMFRGVDEADIFCWWTFDKQDFDRTLGAHGKYLDKSGNDNHLDWGAFDGDDTRRFGEHRKGPLNHSESQQGPSTISGSRWFNTSITGHDGGDITLSFWMKVTNNPSGGVLDHDIIVMTDGVDEQFKMWWDVSTSEIVVEYGGSEHARIDPTVFSTYNDWMLVRVNNKYVWIDDNQYGGVEHNIGTEITDILYKLDGLATIEIFPGFDEILIMNGSMDDNLMEGMPSLSDIPMRFTKELRAEFDPRTKTRWDDWKPSNLLLYAIFDEGVEDISPYRHTITVAATAGEGYYKQGGFVRAIGDPFKFDLKKFIGVDGETEINLSDGWTLMWKGNLIGTGNIINFNSITIGADNGTLNISIDTPTGPVVDIIDVNQEYHEFSLIYSERTGIRLFVDGVVSSTRNSRRSSVNVYRDRSAAWGYTRRAEIVVSVNTDLTGEQSFGGSLVSDLVFITEVLEPEKMGYLPQEEIYWRKYYRVSGNSDFGNPVLVDSTRRFAKILYGDRYLGRIEAGNPLIMVNDRKDEGDSLFIEDQNDEWRILLGRDVLRDSAQGQLRNMGGSVAHKYMLAPHLRSFNGFGVFTGLDSEDKDPYTRRAMVHVNAPSDVARDDPIEIEKVNRSIFGFFHWPLWDGCVREGGDMSGGSMAVQGFRSQKNWSGTSSNQWKFRTHEPGAYLTAIRMVWSTATNVWAGDAGVDNEGFFNASVAAYKSISKTTNVIYGDLDKYHDYGRRVNVSVWTTDGSGYVDYGIFLPLSNGTHYPLDFIHQLMARNG